jgi:hypothetical protein
MLCLRCNEAIFLSSLQECHEPRDLAITEYSKNRTNAKNIYKFLGNRILANHFSLDLYNEVADSGRLFGKLTGKSTQCLYKQTMGEASGHRITYCIGCLLAMNNQFSPHLLSWNRDRLILFQNCLSEENKWRISANEGWRSTFEYIFIYLN